jgi:2-polyprenyl-3-methyl-5-hydroxy-6-metoxy-1,4-benzoquinol methylase
MAELQRSTEGLRLRFEEIYEAYIVGGGFFESDEYYKFERERYWRTLKWFCQLNILAPARILEIGGGQLALLCKMLYGDDCTVGDISQRYVSPLQRAGIEFITFNLAEPEASPADCQFDVVLLLEVIEHIPLPAHVTIERIKPFLKPDGLLFLTTPNLFRARNLIRMFLGVEFLDRFTTPLPGQGLGHQLEYSADHLRWQLERAGMEIVLLAHDSLGRTGHSMKARIARKLLAPLDLRPIWRDGLVAAARKSTGRRR